MNADHVELGSAKTITVVSNVDMDELTESVWGDLHGQVEKAEVRHVLDDLLPKYHQARILTFIPILMRRDAVEILRH